MPIVKGILIVRLSALIQINENSSAEAQYAGISDSIAKYRMGKPIIKAKPGDMVQVEQLRHEYWCGCAIANSMADGSMKESDLKQYNETGFTTLLPAMGIGLFYRF